MHHLIITKTAENHLEDTAAWTLKNWGSSKVEDYKHSLEMGLCSILDNAHIGQDVSYIKSGYRKLLIEQH